MKDVIFRADDNFIEYLLKIGFERRHVDSPKKYFTKEDTVQVRLNFHKEGTIAFIDLNGNKIEEKKQFTKTEVETYIVGNI